MPTYRLSRMLSKGLELEEGLISKFVVSGRRFDWFLHGFWGCDRGYCNIWGILAKSQIFYAEALEGTALNRAGLPLLTDAFKGTCT